MPDVHTKTTVTCIIALHREGLLAHTTLSSIASAREYAEAEGFFVEFVITLDKHDAFTENILRKHPGIRSSDIIDFVQYGDLGLSRNHAVAKASGEYIVCLDGDDYYSRNYIAATVREAMKDSNAIIFPEYLFCFDEEYVCHRLGGPADSVENSYALFSGHHFCSRVVAHQSVFDRNKYVACSKGFGFEDWHWTCEAKAKGIALRQAAGTVLFYRRRRNSMAQVYAREYALIPPSKFFEMLPDPISIPRTMPIGNFPNVSLRTLIKECAFYVLGLLPKRLALDIYMRLRGKFIREKSIKYPPPVQQALTEAAAIDGLLHPEMIPVAPYRGELSYDLVPGMAYARVWHSLKSKQFDIVFLGSHLFVGGADLMFANYMKVEAESKKRVLCLITGNSANDFSRVPFGVEILEFGQQTAGLSESQKNFVMARLLIQLAPPIIHAVNDWCAFELIKKYGTALKHQSRIFASIFADAQDEHNIHYGTGTRFIRDLFPYCHRIINDNRITAIEWSQRLGLPLDFFHPVYGAVELTPQRETGSESLSRKVMWAGRFDKEKRLDILLQIAKLSPDFHFDVYGRAVLQADSNINQLKKLPNVTLYGSYTAFSRLPHEQYACLIYTTQCDGMPNVILEAVANGLPVIASARGGIPDFITNDTGWLIADHEDATAFCQAIHEVVANREEAQRRTDNARHLLEKRHSFATFKASLLAAYDG